MKTFTTIAGLTVVFAAIASERICHPRFYADPTLWKGADGKYYAYATTGGSGMLQYLSSDDALTWKPTGKCPFAKELRTRIYEGWKAVWAPDHAVIQGENRLYVTLYNSADDSAIGMFRLRGGETGEAYDLHIITHSKQTGIRDTIDPEVVSDPDTGRLWLFFGSVGMIHRVELASDGLSVKSGAKYVHVAGSTDKEDPTRATVFEGSYLHRRNGWWYLFVSAGRFQDKSYCIRVGRARTLEGEFLDRNGRKMTDGFATIVIETEGNEFYGPGHNGDFLVGSDGVERIYYHSHWRKLDRPKRRSPRIMLARRLVWDAEGWPRTISDAPANAPAGALEMKPQRGNDSK